ncbi:MAG: hypothetical protein ACW97O_10775 [Candidatus Thorarchaeota archaeon]
MTETPETVFSEDEDFDDDLDPQIVLADRRYEIIGDILCEVYEPGEEKWTLSDMLDSVLVHRYLGLPIFLVIMWAMFHFTFTLGLHPYSQTGLLEELALSLYFSPRYYSCISPYRSSRIADILQERLLSWTAS